MLGRELLISLLPIVAFVSAQNEDWRYSRSFSRFPQRYIPRPDYEPPKPAQTVATTLSTETTPTSTTAMETTTEVNQRQMYPTARSPLVPHFNPIQRPIFFRPHPFQPRPYHMLPASNPNYGPPAPKPDVTYVYPENYKPVEEPALVHESEIIPQQPSTTTVQSQSHTENPDKVAIVYPVSNIQPKPSPIPKEPQPDVHPLDVEQQAQITEVHKPQEELNNRPQSGEQADVEPLPTFNQFQQQSSAQPQPEYQQQTEQPPKSQPPVEFNQYSEQPNSQPPAESEDNASAKPKPEFVESEQIPNGQPQPQLQPESNPEGQSQPKPVFEQLEQVPNGQPQPEPPQREKQQNDQQQPEFQQPGNQPTSQSPPIPIPNSEEQTHPQPVPEIPQSANPPSPDQYQNQPPQQSQEISSSPANVPEKKPVSIEQKPNDGVTPRFNIPKPWSKPTWSQIINKLPSHPYPWMPTTAKPLSLPSRLTTIATPVYQPPALRSKAPYKPVQTIGLMDYKCAEPYGYYPLPHQCDAFVECKANTAMQIECPDGLHFNPKAEWPEYPCDYPSQVKCGANLVKQAPQPTANCPRQYGYFPSESGDCGKYIMCQEGQATEMSCPAGLAFNYATSICDWPANVPSCNPDVFKGFTCPAPDQGKPSDFIYKYREGKSCKKYIACQHGSPRLLSCDAGFSFDDVTKSCINSDLVKDCV